MSCTFQIDGVCDPGTAILRVSTEGREADICEKCKEHLEDRGYLLRNVDMPYGAEIPDESPLWDNTGQANR